MGRFLCVDYGKVRVGFAYSDERKILATPWQTLLRTTPFKEIQGQIASLGQIEVLIVGLPLELTGAEGPMAKEAKLYGEGLAKQLAVPLVFWDERFSSAFGDKLMKEDSLSRKKRASLSDKLAAALILQNYLDSSTFLRKPQP